MRKWIDLFEEECRLPEHLYHGTTLAFWQSNKSDTLYLTTDKRDAENYADEAGTTQHTQQELGDIEQTEIVHIIITFKMDDLLPLQQKFQPDWGWEYATSQSDWRETLNSIGSFCIEGFPPAMKKLGKIEVL